MTTRYALNGYVLPGTTQKSGIWLLEATEYAPALSARRADLFIPQVSYEVPLWEDPLSNITLTLQVRVQGTSEDNLRQQWNKLIGLLWAGGLTPITVTRYRGSYTDTAEAQLISTTSPDFSCASNRLSVTILLNIPGGAWRGPIVDQEIFEPSESAPPFTSGVNSTLPIVDALIRVTGPMPGTLEVVTGSGTGITFNATGLGITAGKWLLIDCYSMRAVIKTDSGWDPTTFTQDVSGKLAFLGSGPLSISNYYGGPSATPSSFVFATKTMGTGPVVVRSRSAVA